MTRRTCSGPQRSYAYPPQVLMIFRMIFRMKDLTKTKLDVPNPRFSHRCPDVKCLYRIPVHTVKTTHSFHNIRVGRVLYSTLNYTTQGPYFHMTDEFQTPRKPPLPYKSGMFILLVCARTFGRLWMSLSEYIY